MSPRPTRYDELDLTLLATLEDNPRAGVLELARSTGVARGTVQARLARLEEAGVIVGYGPQVDVRAAGFPVQALVTLEIAQGALEEVTEHLLALPNVLEAYGTTGVGDVWCRVAAASHEELQQVLLDLNRGSSVVRSTSVIVLSTLIRPRALPLLRSQAVPLPPRSPGFRSRPADPAG